MRAWELGARATATRLLAGRAPLALLLGLALAALAAYLERRTGGSGAVDRALTRDSFGLLLPLVGYGTYERATLGGRLDATARIVSRHGARGREAWLGAALTPTALLTVLGMSFAVVTVLFARGASDPALLRDLWQSAWIGALGGAGYSAWLALGSDLGRAGSGRKWILLGDLLLGSTTGSLALLWPRAHIRNLLGGQPALELAQGTALAALLLSTLFAALVALRRVRD
jgi:hypothetical protein